MTTSTRIVNTTLQPHPNPLEKSGIEEPCHSSMKVAEMHFQLTELSQENADLEGREIEHLNKGEVCYAETSKVKSVAYSVFSWLASTRLSIWTTVKALQSIRFFMLLGAPAQDDRARIDANLNKLTGSVHLSKMLHAISPKIASLIQNKLVSLELHESVNEFLKKEHFTLHTLMDVLIPVIYQNFALDFKKNHEKNGPHKNISMSDVLAHIGKIIHKHFPYINETIEVIERTPDMEKRDKIICHVFAGMVNEFLSIGLPKGVEDLPLVKIPYLSQYFWKLLQKKVLPPLFYSLYRQFALPLCESKKETLLQIKGGKTLVSLAQLAAEQTTELLPTILYDTEKDVQVGKKNNYEASSISIAISKAFCTLLNGSDLLKNWISSWFSKELIIFGISDNLYIKKIWELLGGYLEPLLIHVFVTLTQFPVEKVKGRIPDAIGIILIRLLSMVSRFYNENRVLIDERIKEVVSAGKDYNDDGVLLEYFRPFADELICAMGLSDPAKLPIPNFLQELVVDQLKIAAPGILLRQYIAITNTNTNINSTQRKLRSLLFDPRNLNDPELTIKIVSALYKQKESMSIGMFLEFYNQLWQESGTERIAKALEAMCSVLSSELIDSLMAQLGISDQKFLKNENNQFMVYFRNGLHSYVESVFIEILVHIIETSEKKVIPAKENHPKSLIIIDILIQLGQIIDDKLKGINNAFAKIVEKHANDEIEFYNEAHQLFAAFGADLHKFIGVNPFKRLPLDAFPVGESIKELLWTCTKDYFLPEGSIVLYQDLMAWHGDLQKSYEEIEKSYHTSHPKWACKVMAQFTTDYLRHYLLNSTNDASKLLVASLIDYYDTSNNNSGRYVRNTLKELEGESEAFFSDNLRAAAESKDAKFAQIWPALTLYSEAAIAKFFAEFSKTLRTIEHDNPDFIVDLAIQIIKETAKHFAIVARATEEAGVDKAYEVPFENILSAFGTELHDGIPLDPSASSDEKDLVRLKGCFIPLSLKLMKLANLSVKDFPLPSFMREQFGEAAIMKIMPLALMHAFQKAMEPQVRNVMMLNFVQMFYEAFNGIEKLKKDRGLEEASMHPCSKQKHLYETCGKVVLELIKLIPDTAVQYVFMKEKVKNMSANAIGDALMPYLSRQTLLQIIDNAIYSGLPEFHPAKWEGKLGREDLVPRKAFVRPDGNMELKPVKEFSFDFPTSLAEIKAYENAKQREESEIRTELRDGFTKTISQQLYVKAGAFVKSLWIGLHEHLNDFVKLLFPEKGLEVKAMLDHIFSRIFFDVIGSIVQFLTIPIIILFRFIAEKTVIDDRSEDIIKNLGSEAFENLFYKWTDTVIDALIRLQNKPHVRIAT